MKREQNKANTRRKIFFGFIELLKDHELGDISMTDIAEHIGVKRSTIYGYYSSVDDIKESLFKANNDFSVRYIKEHFSFLDTGDFITKIDVKEALLPLCQKIAEYPDHVFLIEKLDFYSMPIMQAVFEVIKRIVRQNNPDDKNTSYYEEAIKYALYGVVREWLKNRVHESTENVVDVMTSLIFTKVY